MGYKFLRYYLYIYSIECYYCCFRLMPTCCRTGLCNCTKNYFHWTLCKFNA